MKPEKLTVFAILSGIVFSMLCINLINAEFILGNQSYSLEKQYGPLDLVKGWINISLNNQKANSMLTAFSSNISLIDFLDENGINCDSSTKCSCFPTDCRRGYDFVGGADVSKTFQLSERKSKTIGIKIISDDVNSITGISFNISTNAGKSCLNPLSIDILDDDSYEWKFEEVSDDASCFIENPKGCFSENRTINNSAQILSNYQYCETIKVPASKAFKLGARVKGNGTASFEMNINLGQGYGCSIINMDALDSEKEISCNVVLDEPIAESTDALVCIKTLAGSTYTIKYENYEPVCGKSIENNNEYPKDFDLSAKPIKYAAMSRAIIFNQELVGEEINLASRISDYINSRYNGNCSEGCIVPIRLYPGTSQYITINKPVLNYSAGGIPATIDKIYEVSETSPLIDSSFLILDLEKANLVTPEVYGKTDLELKLGDKQIAKEEINIKRIPKITGLIPGKVPVLVSSRFYILAENPSTSANESGLIYTWDFGDGSSQTTTEENTVEHIYSELKDYSMVVSVSNSVGTAKKTFKVTAVTPYDSINSTLNQYKEDLKNIEAEVNKLPEWIRKEIEKSVDVAELKKKVDKEEQKYKETLQSESEELTQIMKELLALGVPYRLVKTNAITIPAFFPDIDEIELDSLGDLDIGILENTKEEYYKGLVNWQKSNLEVKAEGETYTFYYKDKASENIFSRMKIDLQTKKSIDELYVVINGDSTKIKFKDDFKQKDTLNGIGLIFSDLEESQKQSIEFLHPKKTGPNPPYYITPPIGDIEFSLTVGPCNHNKKCEEKEDYKNCRDDCKPWNLAFLYLGILLLITFIVYIILQEWYKRHYESYLFKDRNQLFNLINYMYNSTTQGIKKPDILNRLIPLKWSKEQLEYAWRKFRGQRTGMWEIPVFKWYDNIRVKKEIDKRKSTNTPPKR